MYHSAMRSTSRWYRVVVLGVLLLVTCAPAEATPVRSVTSLEEAARALPGARANRVGVFGHSRGSMAALAVAFYSTDVWAVVALAGYLPRGAANLKAPVLILQGTADNVIPVQQARQFEAELRSLGKPVEAVYYEAAPHTVPFDPPGATTCSGVPWRSSPST